MRLALLAISSVALAGCFVDTSSGDDSYYYEDDSGWGSGWGGTDGTVPTYGCQSDAECPGNVCARTRECLPASEVRAISTTWTVDGALASSTSCSGEPRLAITFSRGTGTIEQWGYAPVPCKAGKFTIDKFPIRFDRVQLAGEYDYSGGDFGQFDATGTVMLDLPY
jgi:hypothetical protein